MTLEELIERQCDNMATGTQMREFLRDDYGNEPLLRELLRLNLEQFSRTLKKELGQKEESPNLFLAVEFGYRRCEQGHNLEATLSEYKALLTAKITSPKS